MSGPICAACRKPVRAAQAASAVEIRDTKGKVTGIRHGKCKWRETRTSRIGGRHTADAPDALHVHAEDLRADDLTDDAVADAREAEFRLAALRDAGAPDDQVAVAERQLELARAHVEEPSEKGWADWRE